jgi:hypothetical protein
VVGRGAGRSNYSDAVSNLSETYARNDALNKAGDNTRTTRLLATEDKARRYIDAMGAALAIEERTTATALVEYTAHLADKGDQPASIEVTRWAIAHMFPDESALRSLNAKRCAALYDELRTRPSARTGRPLAVDTHRNILAQAKSFLAWCVKRGWIAANPLAAVEGIGKRRPRGKSLGKAGNELRVKQARTCTARRLSWRPAATAARPRHSWRCCWVCARVRSSRGAPGT